MATSATSQIQDNEILSASLALSQIPLFLRNKLHPLLPYSLPIYRRCQFHLHQCRVDASRPNRLGRPPDPELWVALSATSQIVRSSSSEWLTSWLASTQKSPFTSPLGSNGEEHEQEQWLACHIDLREPGQTQIWAFGSWEATDTPILMSPDRSHDDKSIIPSRAQLALGRSLFRHLRTAHIPGLPSTPSAQYLEMKAAGKVVSAPYKRSKVLFGSIAETSYWLVEDENVVLDRPDWLSDPMSTSGRIDDTSVTIKREPKQNGLIAREDRPYLKYLLRLPLSPLPSDSDVSFSAGPLSTSHLQTMLDRSVIPRSLETLQALVSVGLFPSGSDTPVTWGILSKDASISSIHTEDAYRGRALAERVSRELIKMMPSRFMTDVVAKKSTGSHDLVHDGEGVDGVMWAHVDVSPKNIPSRRVFEKMGAEIGWRVGWVEVDVGEEHDRR